MSNLEVFASIGSMVEDIVATQGKEPIQLELYRRLIEKTGPTAKTAIAKHITAFNDWYGANEQAILAKEHSNISHSSYISYSDNVYLPMRLILDRCSEEERNTLWLHIITIRVKSNPDSIDILRQFKSDTPPNPNSVSFIEGMMQDIESEMKKIVNTVTNHEHYLDSITSSTEKCSMEECQEIRIYECAQGCKWGLCEDCFDTYATKAVTEETTPLEIIEKLAARGGISRLMKGFSDKAGSGGINPMELMGSLQGFSDKNGGPDMGAMMGVLGKSGKSSVCKVDDLF